MAMASLFSRTLFCELVVRYKSAEFRPKPGVVAVVSNLLLLCTTWKLVAKVDLDAYANGTKHSVKHRRRPKGGMVARREVVFVV